MHWLRNINFASEGANLLSWMDSIVWTLNFFLGKCNWLTNTYYISGGVLNGIYFLNIVSKQQILDIKTMVDIFITYINILHIYII